jgi:hypothetical protein
MTAALWMQRPDFFRAIWARHHQPNPENLEGQGSQPRAAEV